MAALMGLGMLLPARSAVAQARGTLQATATVVDTRVSARTLSTMKRQLQTATAPQRSDSVAIIRIERPKHPRHLVVVTIEYSRN